MPDPASPPPPPPSGGARPGAIPGLDMLSKHLAWLLDNSLKIPGTNLRVGLDPLIGLIPGFGDTVAAAMGSLILADAIQRGIPGHLLLRMGGNMLLNAAIGAVPVVGDLFSAWFKSNARNYAMLSAWAQGNPQPPAGPQGRVLVLAMVALVLIAGLVCFFVWWLLAVMWRMIFG